MVTLTDTWPAGFTRGATTTTQGSCAPATASFVCNLGTLAAGGSATIKAAFTVPATTLPGPQTNTVLVASATSDTHATNDTASDTDTVNAQADLSVSKTDGVDTVTAGDGLTYTYTIVVGNAGPSDAQMVTLTDTWPAGFTRGATTTTQGSCAPATASFVCNLGTLAAGGSATIIFFNDTPTSEISTLSLHAALPICATSDTHAT